MKQDNYNSGWSVLVKLALTLVVPTILGEIWLARNAWVLDERVTHLMKDVDNSAAQLQHLHERIIQLELSKRP